MTNRLAVGVFLLVSACGGGSKSPSTPTPTIAQVGGLWGYVGTQTSVSGGECVGAAFTTGNGAQSAGTLAIAQNGNALTATSTSDGTGDRCDYTGTAGINSIVLNGTNCTGFTGRRGGFVCGPGAIRDVQIATLAVNATQSGNALNGTSVATYNVFIAGTNTGVGPMTLTASYTATRR